MMDSIMDVRKEFLEFFKGKGHEVYDSMPLTPDDPTLLFTNAGMVQFKDIFTGDAPIPATPRATSSQTCIRAGGKHNDLENVGHTRRHHTFFEMLGNFSFGDYFKEEAIAYAWEFVTEVLKLPKEKLWVTVHDSDDEAEAIWKKYIAADRIKRFGDKDNFWSMGDTGACGPCSEIFIDQGAEEFNSDEDYLGGDGDRFLEIWNLVFMQYERSKEGTLTPLPKPSIDTGMGLERVEAVMAGKYSNFDTKLFMPMIHEVEKIAQKEYQYASGASFRVIADHIRSTTFLLAQGVSFDKEGRGYVLRRILRRAVRHGYLLGIKEPFIYRLVDTLTDIMGEAYPYIVQKKEHIKEMIMLEEERFYKTIGSGIELFEEELAKTQDIFSGSVAFKLYDTYGFPLDLTEDMLKDKGLRIDTECFERLMGEQRDRAKASWKGSGDSDAKGDFKELAEEFGENRFVGYDRLEETVTVLALLDEQFKRCDSLSESGWVMLDQTPFYAMSGGQCGDSGQIKDLAKVTDTKKFLNVNLSRVEVEREIKVGERVEAVVDRSRIQIAAHHSATHLLHSALKKILGEHVSQAGSLVESDRLRFDFSHPKAMSSEEIDAVEQAVNEVINANSPVATELMAQEEAIAKGAMALFGEKYDDEVRVVSMGAYSMELCGGTHVESVGQIGSFFITKESGVSAGVRRIEAVCAQAAYGYAKNFIRQEERIKEEVKNRDPLLGIKRLKEMIEEQKREIELLQKSSKKEMGSVQVGSTQVIVDTIEAGDIKKIIDDLKNEHENVAVMLFQKKGDKMLIAAGSKGTGVKAGAWIKEIAPIVGGGGGGRDDFAQAGGKNPAGLDEALKKSLEYAKEHL
jgi:alanyl-tRNA synthetase